MIYDAGRYDSGMKIHEPELPPTTILEAMPYEYGLRMDWTGTYHGGERWAHWTVVLWTYPTGVGPVEKDVLGGLYRHGGQDAWEYSPFEGIAYGIQEKLIKAFQTAGVRVKGRS